jgi:hypothetical protein
MRSRATATTAHIRATFTLPPDVVAALETVWRSHINDDGTLSRSKSNYISDLVRRDIRAKRARGKQRSA